MEKKVEVVAKNIIDVSDLVKTTKFVKVEKKLPLISSLVTTTVRYAEIGEVENKTPDLGNVTKKTGYNAKISDI